jgi:hypothetical protein
VLQQLLQQRHGSDGLLLHWLDSSGSSQGVHGLDPNWASAQMFSSGALLREMPWLATSEAATSLAAVGGIEGVAVSSRRIPAGRAVA